MNDETLILASASPRRQQLLSLLGIRYRVARSDYQEIDDPEQTDHLTMALEHATGKAMGVAQRNQAPLPVLAADTMVIAHGNRLGKPEDPAGAEAMLQSLSGYEHQVITGVCLMDKEKIVHTCAEITKVTFRRLTNHEIIEYVKTGEPMDKAGAYGIQGFAASFVSGINGCYYNVMGLPVSRLTLMMQEAGIDCPDWKNIRGRSD